MTYSNSRNPKAMKWIMWSSLIIGFTFYIIAFASEKDFWNILGMSLYLIFYCLFFWLIRKSEYCILDEEAGVVFTGETKKYPMKIDSIRSITYKESKKGKFRSLFIHDTGVGFFSIRTSRKTADAIVEKLISLNPGITVTHSNYL